MTKKNQLAKLTSRTGTNSKRTPNECLVQSDWHFLYISFLLPVAHLLLDWWPLLHRCKETTGKENKWEDVTQQRFEFVFSVFRRECDCKHQVIFTEVLNVNKWNDTGVVLKWLIQNQVSTAPVGDCCSQPKLILPTNFILWMKTRIFHQHTRVLYMQQV